MDSCWDRVGIIAFREHLRRPVHQRCDKIIALLQVSSMPTSSSKPSKTESLLPANTLKIVAGAFVLGLLCFALAWLRMRDDTPVAAPQNTAGNTPSELAPLPAPLPANGDRDGAADMPSAPPAPSAPAAAPAPIASSPTPSNADDSAVNPAPQLAAAGDQDLPQPLPNHSPAPRYPPAALRRGDSGTVIIRVDVDSAGKPTNFTLIGRSGSRDLDRAAMSAAKKWRFQPAMQGGQAVAASVDIPFDFKPR